jgi:hypothetical protein
VGIGVDHLMLDVSSGVDEYDDKIGAITLQCVRDQVLYEMWISTYWWDDWVVEDEDEEEEEDESDESPYGAEDYSSELPTSIREVMNGMPGAFRPEKAGMAEATFNLTSLGPRQGTIQRPSQTAVASSNPGLPTTHQLRSTRRQMCGLRSCDANWMGQRPL